MNETARAGARATEALAAALLYLLVTLWFLWPLPTALSTHLLYKPNAWSLIEADADFVLWAMSWTAHALVHQPAQLFDANIFYPMPGTLALSDHDLGHQPIFAPVFLLSGNPVLAGNVLLLFEHWLAAFGAFLLARRFLESPAALVAGATFAFLPSRLAALVHPHVLAVGWLPLSLFFVDRWLERGRTRDGALMATALGLQLLTSFYLAYMLLIAWACALPVLLLRWREVLDRRRLLGGLAWCGAGAVPFLLASVPYVTLRTQGYLPDYTASQALHPFGLIPGMAENAAWRVLVLEGPGPIALVLALIGCLPSWRGRRGIVVALGLTLLIGGWLIGRGPAAIPLGPLHIPGPYSLLQLLVPGFDVIRIPSRMLTASYLGIALLAGLGAARLLAWVEGRLAKASVAEPGADRSPTPIEGHLRTRWLGALVLIALSLSLPFGRPENVLHERPVGDATPPATRWLAEHADGRALLELPPRGFRPAAARMLASTAHWLPLLDGYTSHPPPNQRYLAWRTGDLPEAAALDALLADVDIGWILVHTADLGDKAKRRWEDTDLPPSLEKVGQFGDDVLYRVLAHGPTRGESPLYDPKQTSEGAPRAPLGASCPGRIELVKQPDAVWPTEDSIPIRVRIHNDGDRPWPGAGLLPKYQVQMRACLARPTAPPCSMAGVILLHDVAPGQSLDVDTQVQTSAWPGDFGLQIELFQVGADSLVRCGVAPLSIPVALRKKDKTLPEGSYWMSCRDCARRDHALRCECRNGAGVWTETTTDADCPHGFANRDGRLECEGSAAARPPERR